MNPGVPSHSVPLIAHCPIFMKKSDCVASLSFPSAFLLRNSNVFGKDISLPSSHLQVSHLYLLNLSMNLSTFTQRATFPYRAKQNLICASSCSWLPARGRMPILWGLKHSRRKPVCTIYWYRFVLHAFELLTTPHECCRLDIKWCIVHADSIASVGFIVSSSYMHLILAEKLKLNAIF